MSYNRYDDEDDDFLTVEPLKRKPKQKGSGKQRKNSYRQARQAAARERQRSLSRQEDGFDISL
jgi:hypothetical protein